jgi:hypothetical protein
LCLFSPT